MILTSNCLAIIGNTIANNAIGLIVSDDQNESTTNTDSGLKMMIDKICAIIEDERPMKN